MSRTENPTATMDRRQSHYGSTTLRRCQSERAMARDTKTLIGPGKNRLGQTEHGSTVDTLDLLVERDGETPNLGKLSIEDLRNPHEILERAR